MGLIPAIIERLKQTTAKAVYDTHLLDSETPPYPHLLVWEFSTSGAISKPAISGAARAHETLIGVMPVGLSVDSVRVIAHQVKNLLDGWEPGTISGVTWNEPEYQPMYARPIVRDKDTPLLDGNAVLWGSDFYKFTGTSTKESQ
jgi:hypothetical protein